MSIDVGNIPVGTPPTAAEKAQIAAALAVAPTASPTITGVATIPKIILNEIQCEGTTSGTAQTIKYDSKEHRFRDYDASPTNLMVIKKTDGESIGKVGINNDTPKVALHVVGGQHSSGLPNEALRVIGGAFFDDWVRVGHFTDTTRNAIVNPTNGIMIYNTTHHEYQGYEGNGTGWVKFNTSPAS
tara:strand:+ start:8079 stop:8633 length:555 start_codon:yes stop_codon:yes gene_type:complete